MWLLGRISHGLWVLMPFTATLILVLVGIAQWHLPTPVAIPPQFGLIALFYWGLHRPSVLPLLAVAAIGLIQDILGGDRIGLNVLIYLVGYRIVVANGEFFEDKGFTAEWIGFLLLAFGAGFAAWGITSVFAGAIVDPLPAVSRIILDVAVYPLFAWFFGLIRRGLES